MLYEFRSHLSRTGVILSNISILLLCVTPFLFMAGIVAPLIIIFVLFLWLLTALFTLGLVLLAPEWWGTFESIMVFFEDSGVIAQICLQIAVPAFIVGLALSVVSTILLAFEPSVNKHYGRMAVTGVVMGIIVAVVVGIIVSAAAA